MSHPQPIIAYHIVFGAYGFWLPNDPRGPWSRYVWADRLKPFGRPQPISTATNKPSRLASASRRRNGSYGREWRTSFVIRQFAFPAYRPAVAYGFAEIIHRLKMIVYAAAIMPDHVHLVVARQEMYAERIAGYLKRAASPHNCGKRICIRWQRMRTAAEDYPARGRNMDGRFFCIHRKRFELGDGIRE